MIVDENFIKILQAKSENEIRRVLSEFVVKNAKTMTFPDLSKEKRKKIVDAIFSRLQDQTAKSCHELCLETFRILSRDKTNLDEIFTKDIVDLLVSMTGLVSEEEVLQENNTVQPQDPKVVGEAQRCLCNLIYNSSAVRRICCNNSCIEGVMLRLRTYWGSNLSHDVKYFDMRMLFVITALCADIRPRIRKDFHGLTYLMEAIDLIIKCNMEKAEKSNKQQKSGKKFNRSSRRGWEHNDKPVDIPCLNDSEVDLACEILKVLFNLTVSVDKYSVDEEEEAHFLRLVCILHDLLLCDANSAEKKEELESHTVNLLINMPPASFEELLTPLADLQQGSGKNELKEYEFYGMNIEAVGVLLSFLEKRLDQQPKKESLIPILTCLTECSRANRIVRKYLKQKILPPLKDVMSRPEEGSTLRNKLVKLMTSPYTELKEISADLLFVLCKETVSRLVKYTGYGNAAGLLANRGLMRDMKAKDYSSDSEDSDTEEYLKYKDMINPVLGCYEEPRPDPMAGMTEEQKEFEAMQLVNMMDKLSRDGVMKPMRIGDDGRPHPIEHILEFRDTDTESE